MAHRIAKVPRGRPGLRRREAQHEQRNVSLSFRSFVVCSFLGFAKVEGLGLFKLSGLKCTVEVVGSQGFTALGQFYFWGLGSRLRLGIC